MTTLLGAPDFGTDGILGLIFIGAIIVMMVLSCLIMRYLYANNKTVRAAFGFINKMVKVAFGLLKGDFPIGKTAKVVFDGVKCAVVVLLAYWSLFFK
jgi:hypothetical protein